jgi:5-methylcytosine-specific restriction endonuclease McrA
VCQAERRRAYRQRQKANGGHHTEKEWLTLLSQTPQCPGCRRPWSEIPRRPNLRYKNRWTKDHIVPLARGGTDDIGNIQPLCFRCNFSKGVA